MLSLLLRISLALLATPCCQYLKTSIWPVPSKQPVLDCIPTVSVLNQFLTPTEALGGYGSRGSGYGKSETGYKTPGNRNTFVGTSPGLPSQNTTRRGLGLSAWGIVILIVALILAGMGFYYFSICYTICQPTKNKYDKMGMPTLA